MIDKELKLCKYCGTTELHISEEPSNDGTITWYKVMHKYNNPCGITMLNSDKDKLILQWNTSLYNINEDIKVKRAEITFALNRLQIDKVHKLVDEIIELLSQKK